MCALTGRVLSLNVIASRKRRTLVGIVFASLYARTETKCQVGIFPACASLTLSQISFISSVRPSANSPRHHNINKHDDDDAENGHDSRSKREEGGEGAASLRLYLDRGDVSLLANHAVPLIIPFEKMYEKVALGHKGESYCKQWRRQ